VDGGAGDELPRHQARAVRSLLEHHLGEAGEIQHEAREVPLRHTEHDGVRGLEPHEEPGALEHQGALPVAEAVEHLQEIVAEAGHDVRDAPLRPDDEGLSRVLSKPRRQRSEEHGGPI